MSGQNEFFGLSVNEALHEILSGKTVKDNDYGYFYSYPSKDEQEHFCESNLGNELIRSRKNDVGIITINEFVNYKDFMGVDVKFRIV